MTFSCLMNLIKNECKGFNAYIRLRIGDKTFDYVHGYIIKDSVQDYVIITPYYHSENDNKIMKLEGEEDNKTLEGFRKFVESKSAMEAKVQIHVADSTFGYGYSRYIDEFNIEFIKKYYIENYRQTLDLTIIFCVEG